MIILSHPTGNAFARAVLLELVERDVLDSFHTTLAFSPDCPLLSILPASLKDEFLRRSFPCPRNKIITHWQRETIRFIAGKTGFSPLTTHESGWASVDSVWQEQDRAVSKYLIENVGKDSKANKITGIYAYEDAALLSFRAARDNGISCYYDLPIAYWKTSQQLLAEEAQRYPQWEMTLGGTRDSEAKLARKTEEIELADVVICPSQFVLNTLPVETRAKKMCLVAEFGTPDRSPDKHWAGSKHNKKLRVLFAGGMGQRKGLADVFAAMKIVNRSDVELVVMGSLIAPLEFYRSQLADFTYEPPRPHAEVLKLMQSCDIFVLPSIVEGRALVQQEAMVSGLPLIVTANAGGEDLIDEGKTGFLVPIRNPQAIAEKIDWFANNRVQLEAMSSLAILKAKEITWEKYRAKIFAAIKELS